MHEELDAAIVEFDGETGVGTVTMNRPDALNALNAQLSADIREGLELLAERDAEADGVALRAVVIEGAGGRAFSAGADVGEFGGGGGGGSVGPSHYEMIREYPAPVVAKIDGYCLGGGFETALSCDFRIASEDSTFGLPEVGLGFLPGVGGAQFVARLANPAVAKELAMTGKHISAERAADEGLVNEVHPGDELDDAVSDLTAQLAEGAPLAVREIKRSVNLSTEVGLEAGIRYDGKVANALTHTEDFEEGTAAFAEDREPEFEGK